MDNAHSQLQELLGAFVLDALDAQEAALVVAHLAGCAECRDEVDAHREAASALRFSARRRRRRRQ